VGKFEIFFYFTGNVSPFPLPPPHFFGQISFPKQMSLVCESNIHILKISFFVSIIHSFSLFFLAFFLSNLSLCESFTTLF